MAARQILRLTYAYEYHFAPRGVQPSYYRYGGGKCYLECKAGPRPHEDVLEKIALNDAKKVHSTPEKFILMSWQEVSAKEVTGPLIILEDEEIIGA